MACSVKYHNSPKVLDQYWDKKLITFVNWRHKLKSYTVSIWWDGKNLLFEGRMRGGELGSWHHYFPYDQEFISMGDKSETSRFLENHLASYSCPEDKLQKLIENIMLEKLPN